MSLTRALDRDAPPYGAQEATRGDSSLPPAVTVLALAVISLAASLMFWPGHIDADALNQINEARLGYFVDWWAPVLDAMWRVLFLVHLSPGFVLLASTTIFVFSAFELLRTVLSRPVSVVVTLLIVAFPPVLGFLGALQRETWFGVSALAAYALLARVHRGATRRPKLMAGLALLAVWVAMAARQDAVIALLPAIAVAMRALFPIRMSAASHTSTRWSGRWRNGIRAIAGVVGVVVVVAGSQWVIKYPILNTERTYPQQATFYMDLANLSVREKQVLIPPSSFPPQSLQTLAHYNTSDSWLPLAAGAHPPLHRTPGANWPSWVTASEYSTLEHDWLHAILHHPWGYVSERWNAYLSLIGWNASPYAPYNPNFSNNPWGYKALIKPANDAGTRYLSYFTVSPLRGDWLFRAWPYMIISLAVSIDLLRRRRPTQLRVVGAMSAFALVDYLAYFFLTNGDGYRYAWYLVGTTVIATIVDLTARGRTYFAARQRGGVLSH